MIEDLTGGGQSVAQADVVVIGAGTIGLPMATALADGGLSVICIESGGWTQIPDEHPLNEVVQTRSVYAGAAHGRFRCLGGTSTRWGGALIPFLARDVDDAHWPVPHSEIVAFRPAVEKLFDLPDGSYDLPGVMDDDGKSSHIARLAKWPPFGKRNVFNLLAKKARAQEGPRILLNATATTFLVEDGVLRQIVACAPDGATITIQAKEVVFAAGAIESTRLLLLLNQQNDQCLSRHGDQLGRNFHDHLSVVVGRLEVIDRSALNRLAGFRFEKGGAMRNLRFELAEMDSIRKQSRPCFAHIAFEEMESGGFAALRDLFRFLQMRRIPSLEILLRLVAATPWLLRVVWWRFIEKRLLYPDNAVINVHMVIEQAPHAESRIGLSADKVDCFGQPLAQIEWAVNEDDKANLRKAVDLFESGWKASHLAAIAHFIRRKPEEAEAEMALGGGIYHPGGSTRMGDTASSGVVDSQLKVFGLSNVHVASTGVLPTGGGGNPTMMAMMLAFRCVEALSMKFIANKTPARILAMPCVEQHVKTIRN